MIFFEVLSNLYKQNKISSICQAHEEKCIAVITFSDEISSSLPLRSPKARMFTPTTTSTHHCIRISVHLIKQEKIHKKYKEQNMTTITEKWQYYVPRNFVKYTKFFIKWI